MGGSPIYSPAWFAAGLFRAPGADLRLASSSCSGPSDELARRRSDVVGIDSRRGQQLRGRAGARHRADRKLDDDRVWLLLGQRVQHRIADAALRPVVLDGDDGPGLARSRAHRLGIDRLEAVE